MPAQPAEDGGAGDAQAVLVAQGAVALPDAGPGAAYPDQDVRERVERRRRVPGEPLGAGTFGEDPGDALRVEAVRRPLDAEMSRTVKPTADRRGGHGDMALLAQPAGQLGDGDPCAPQGEQFGSVAVELRPALSHERSSRAQDAAGKPVVFP